MRRIRDMGTTAGRSATAVLLAALAVPLVLGPATSGAATAPMRRGATLGTIALTPTRGTVDTSPMLSAAVTSAPCPAGYGDNALLRVGPVGGPYSNIVRPGSEGGYDRAPVRMSSNRSLAAARNDRPADGELLVVVECMSATNGPHAARFETPIVISGGNWSVKGTEPTVRADPQPSSALTGAPRGDTSPVSWILGGIAVLMVGTALVVIRRRRSTPS